MTISRPEALNALDSSVLGDIAAAAEKVRNDEDIRVLVVTGEGKAFVAGADIGEMKSLNADEGRAFGLKGQAALTAIEDR